MLQQTLSRRAFLQIMGVGSAALMVAACPAPSAAPPASEGVDSGGAPAPAATTVEFLAWGDAADIPAWEQLKTMYEERNPNVTVNVTTVADPNANFYPKLQTMLAGGTPPHISSFQGWEWQTYADRDVLAPIDDYIQRDGFADLYPEGIASVEISAKRNGSTYLIPMQLATMVMFYAKQPFDDAGMAYPTNDRTLQDFLGMAEALTNLDGEKRMYGYQANGSWFRDIGWMRGTGEQEFDELVDPRTAQFSNPAIVEIVQLVASDVYNTLKISPTPADTSGGANAIETGNVAMKYEGPWFFPRLNTPDMRDQGTAIPFDVVLMPQGADASRPHRGWAEGIVLPKTDNVDAAWAFASFMGGEEGDKVYAEITGRMPNSLALIESFWIPTIQERFGVENGQAFMEALNRSEVDVVSGIPRSKMWSEVVKPTGWDPLINGSASAAVVLPQVDAALQALLDEYWAEQ